MRHRLMSLLGVLVVFAAASLLGRYALQPLLHQPPAATTGAGAQCMQQALSRRMDPIEARHTCGVIEAALSR